VSYALDGRPSFSLSDARRSPAPFPSSLSSGHSRRHGFRVPIQPPAASPFFSLDHKQGVPSFSRDRQGSPLSRLPVASAATFSLLVDCCVGSARNSSLSFFLLRAVKSLPALPPTSGSTLFFSLRVATAPFLLPKERDLYSFSRDRAPAASVRSDPPLFSSATK